jgi:hypothetical protein
MLARVAALDPPPFFMGGFAEDALLAGTVTRRHEDFDWLLPRSELDLRRGQAESLGFDGIELRVASPLALYQMRVAISSQGSFGELSDRQRASSRALRERFLTGLSEDELTARIEPLR